MHGETVKFIHTKFTKISKISNTSQPLIISLSFYTLHLCPDYLKHALLAICMGEDSGHYAGCAVHSYQTCVRLECAYVQIASDCGRWTPALGQCCQVCKLRTADQMAFYT